MTQNMVCVWDRLYTKSVLRLTRAIFEQRLFGLRVKIVLTLNPPVMNFVVCSSCLPILLNMDPESDQGSYNCFSLVNAY